MRRYFQAVNLLRAMALGAVVTLLCLPRLAHTGVPLGLFVPAAFLSMTLAAGAVTAWGHAGGLVGPFVRGRPLLVGCLLAAAAGAALMPVRIFWTEPLLKAVLTEASDGERLASQFPQTASEQWAVLLWAMSFQMLFLTAAPMCLFSRLTADWRPALAVTVMFRLYVSYRQLGEFAPETVWPLYLMAGGLAAISCLLYARTGLLPVALLAAIRELPTV